MSEENKKKRFKARPLLVVGAGIAAISLTGSACGPVGNLLPPKCVQTNSCNVDSGTPDAGAADGGTTDAGKADGGVGGDQ